MGQPLPDNVVPLPGLGDPRAPQLTPVRASDPETSHHAKLDAYPRSGSRKERALQAFWRQHRMRGDGLTDYELSVILGCLRGSASKVRGKLEEGYWVQASGKVRPTDTGSAAVVWALTPLAVRALAASGG